jgi:hypothetical protein
MNKRLYKTSRYNSIHYLSMELNSKRSGGSCDGLFSYISGILVDWVEYPLSLPHASSNLKASTVAYWDTGKIDETSESARSDAWVS